MSAGNNSIIPNPPPARPSCYGLVVDKEVIVPFAEPTLKNAIPRLIWQIASSMAANLVFNVVFQPLLLPRVVADMIGGLLLSPAVLGAISQFAANFLWEKRYMTNLESLVNLGVIFAMFITGVNVKLPHFAQIGKKTGVFTFLATIMTTLLGSFIMFFMLKGTGNEFPRALFYWAALMSTSCFASFTPCLTRFKLIYTDLGREALAVGLFNELWSWLWIFLAIGVSVGRRDAIPVVFIFMFIFTVVSCLVVGPVVNWISKSKPEGENFDQSTINVVLVIVLACALLSEMVGAYGVFGAFTLGLAMPQDLLATTVIDKMDDCVNGLLLPLYFAYTGLRLNFSDMMKTPQLWVAIFIPLFSKTLCCFLASFFVETSARDSFGLGVLTSSKGLLSVVLISIGLSRGHLPESAYTALWLSILVSSLLFPPIMWVLFRKGMKNSHPFTQRTVQGLTPYDDFRILANVHAARNTPSVMNLLELSDIAPECPVSVYALHTAELIGRGTSMFVVHNSRDAEATTSWAAGENPLLSKKGSQSHQIISAFENFSQQHITSTTLKSMTVYCPIDTMHEDICCVAEDQQVSLIILPFHKQQNVDGSLEDINPEFGPVNQNTMEYAPCSVGLLVDKGFGTLPLSHSTDSSCHSEFPVTREVKIGMIYIGGPDDREALTLAWRLAAHHLVTLTVIRFLVGDKAEDIEPMIDFLDDDDDCEAPFNILVQSEQEMKLDNEFIRQFCQRTKNDEAIQCIEKVSNSGVETVEILREMEHNYDLYVIGRGKSTLSPITIGLAEWSDSPELGAIGDILVTSDFSSHVSVLVVQQYKTKKRGSKKGLSTADEWDGLNF